MTPKLAGIPYQAYFMSCNLDHALYGKLNSSDEEKENDAHVFSKKYKDLIVDFVEFISESSFSVKKPYLESWSFVKKGKNSLKRYTNLNICIERALSGEWPVKE